MSRKLHTWKIRDRDLQLGERTLVMGILNVTPDSFSDGGLFDDPDRAYARAMQMEQDGADIIDIGAESTRPGAEAISAVEELKRLVPVLKRLKDQLSIPISVDTYKAEVAERALELGVQIINDPSGFTFDPLIAKALIQYDAGFILNHMRGRPETWAALGPLPDVMGSIVKDLDASINRARRAGVDRARMVVDPGIGFGKRREQNLDIIARIGEMTRLELPLLLAPSRKSFLTHAGDQESIFATASAITACVLGGAHIVRVHDVAEMHVVVKVADEIAKSIVQRIEELRPVEKPIRVSSRTWEADDAKARKLRPPIAQPRQGGAATEEISAETGHEIAAEGAADFVGEPLEAAAGDGAVEADSPGRASERPAASTGDRAYPPRGDRPFKSRDDRSGLPRGERSFVPRGDRPFAPRGDRPFKPRDDRSGPPRGDRPFAPREDRPYAPRGESSGPPRGDRPFAPRGDRPFKPRGEHAAPSRGDRPFAPRGDRPFKPRSEHSGSPRGDRPFAPRGNRPFTPSDDRSGPPRGDRPFASRGDRSFKPGGERFGPPRGDRPFAPRGDRPFKPREDRSGPPRGDRPFTPRSDASSGDRPFTPREGGSGAPGQNLPPSDRPFKRDGFRPFKKFSPPRGGGAFKKGGTAGPRKKPRKD